MNQAGNRMVPSGDNEGPFSIEEVLAQEACAIHGKTAETDALTKLAENQCAEDKRRELNADDRGARGLKGENLKRRDAFYIELNKLNRAALCCSGGGIRSASFCLGVIQAFASYDAVRGVLRGKAAAIAQGNESKPADYAAATPAQHGHDEGSEAETYKPIDPVDAALRRLHYLSTVSGGGYVGSWLSSWRSRSSFKTVIENLTGRPSGADIEPPEISWLRAYSNYLTPKLGITSADGWAAAAILVRNLILNWLVIIPILCVALLLLKLIATGGAWFAHTLMDWRILWFAGAGAVFLIITQSFTNSHRPPRRTEKAGTGEGLYFWVALVCAFLSAVCFTIFLSSRWLLESNRRFEDHIRFVYNQLHLTGALDWVGLDLKLRLFLLTAVSGALIYAVGWIAGGLVEHHFKKGWIDFFRWAASGLIYGGIVGLGVYLFLQLGPYPPTQKNVYILLIAVILGVPWIMMSQLVAEIIFTGLASDEAGADADREWLGRAAGWLATLTVSWAILTSLVFAGGYAVEEAVNLGHHQTLVKAGGGVGIISAIVTAVLGGGAGTPAKSSNDGQRSLKALASNVALAFAGPLFVAILIIVSSVGLDNLLIGDALATQLQIISVVDPDPMRTILPWLLIGLVIASIVGLLASCCVNINRFSLHALYRNRLTRCYLGASNEERNPDKFSGFDFDDNLCVHNLWPPKSGEGTNPLSLFHVVNIALNVVSTKRLAWQERKAESFTVSPLHCGATYLGFRNSKTYGGKPKADGLPKADDEAKAKRKNDSGLSLGTALAISGAAVSPNMGYHSSPSMALLLTLFNVRLGWWLGNPGPAGKKTYQEEGPKLAALPLLVEAFGMTTDQSGYVYLSDGGHFENLGLYEMVRRRCRLIILIDAGCDADFTFEDLGNAVRKIYIDLGIRITFDDLEKLKNRPSPKSLSRAMRDAAAHAAVLAARAEEHAAQPPAAAKGRADPKVEGDPPKPEGEAAGAQGRGGGGKVGVSAPGKPPYHAVGVIHYKGADNVDAGDPNHKTADNGYILYIKPAYHGSEKNAGVRSYAIANPTFPHETTADQWFTESQLESYRSLGFEITTNILHHGVTLRDADDRTGKPKLTLHDALSQLAVREA